MQGYPKNLNTKEDYLFVKANFPKEAWQADFKSLLDTESDWFFVSNLESREAGQTDKTHKIEEITDSFSGNVGYAQYVYKSNPQAKIYRLGFTRDEIQGYLK